MRATPFFMIYGDGQRMPTVVHDTIESAEREAKRLASTNPGVHFYVLGTVALAVKNDVHFARINPDDIPF